MYEVEVKAHLRNKAEMKEKLEALGCTFSEELHQVDRVFIPEGLPFPEPLGTPVLRVRQSNDKTFFTLKITQSNRLDCIEREFEISDGEKMVEVIKFLKFYEVPTVDKRRIKTNYKDMEIVLDTVEHLGDFIEAEKIVTTENREERQSIQRELIAELGRLGVPETDVIVDGKYQYMLVEKFGMKKHE